MAVSMRSYSIEEFKGLCITSLDDEEEEEEDIIFEEEDDDDEEIDDVVLGFVKKPKNPHSLLRHLFPSKAGGVPAWLDPINLPSGRTFLCDICGEPLQFMLQVYAPEDVEYAFHRTIFVFICTSMACLRQDQHEQWKRHPDRPSRSVKVFRCQLPRDNPFYSSEPPINDDKPSGAGGSAY
ncbi:hypothetical protein PanWU01x14_187360 [Parasponia andersonii]|uniref:Programmed cell death protein 2, C-terminal n=1 Tax=Parasponia andersonii TaxID=3476 RepID=A0A2P5C3F4_PARAD|nr:hypothetical protein PanWU01x14_187360 [Parasponia andersonii]